MEAPATSAPSSRIPLWSTVARLVLCSVGVALVVLTGIPAAQTIFGNGPPTLRGGTGNSRAFPPTDFTQGCNTELPAQDSKATLIMLVRRFDPNPSTLTVDLRLCFPLPLLYKIRSAGRDHRAAVLRSSGPKTGYRFRARPSYSQIPVGIYFLQYNGDAPDPDGGDPTGPVYVQSLTRETTFGKLVLGPPPTQPEAGRDSFGGPVSIGQLVLPVTSAPNRYPFDWYAAFGISQVEFESDRIGIRGSDGLYDQILPHRVVVVDSPSLNPLLLRVGITREQENDNGIRLELVRPAPTKRFVFIVAAIPGLLALFLGIALLGIRPARFRTEGFIGVIAALLAVLPIRLVLVPSSVTALTAVDYLLGFEMAVLAAIAAVGVAREIRGENPTECEAIRRWVRDHPRQT